MYQNKIETFGIRSHAKASEKYIDVTFHYPDGLFVKTSIPIQYRRTGVDIPENDLDQIHEYLEKIYPEINPYNWESWKEEQELFWSKKGKAIVTKPFFYALAEDFEYKCVNCELPKNSNPARRIQDLKEFGYTIATKREYCPNCNKATTHLILVPIKRSGITGYETWSPKLEAKIIKLLRHYDVFEAKQRQTGDLHIDHKFSEIRWDDKTRRESLEDLTDAEILHDFQLMSNQRNQQKREVCRNCFQTGKRGVVYGIPFFYAGNEDWDASIPQKGKAAEKGCIGCAWYDIERWRQELVKRLFK